MKLLFTFPAADTAYENARKEEEWLAKKKAESGTPEIREEMTGREEKNTARTKVFLILFGLNVLFIGLAWISPLPEIILFIFTIGYLFLSSMKDVRARDKKGSAARILMAAVIVFIEMPLTVLLLHLLSGRFPQIADASGVIIKVLLWIIAAVVSLLCLIFLVILPPVKLILILKRRIRCTQKCEAFMKGYTAVGTDLPYDADPGLGGYPQFAYEYEGVEYIVTYRDSSRGRAHYGMTRDLRIDPDHPECCYDRKIARIHIFSCLRALVGGAVFIAVAVTMVLGIISTANGW